MTKRTLTDVLADWRNRIGEPYRTLNDELVRHLIEVDAVSHALKTTSSLRRFRL